MTDTVTITGEQLVAILKQHIDVVAVGLLARNSNINPRVFIPALAAAFGASMSEITATPDMRLTLELRSAVNTAFADKVKKHAPALQIVQTAGNQAS